jgi:hypothetical protein
MSSGAFPDDPGSRKAVVVLSDFEIEKCGYAPGAAKILLDDEAYVVRYPVELGDSPPRALENIIDANLLRKGAVLVQSPFDSDTYEDAELAPQRFALAKHMYFSTFCMLLGARGVEVDQLDLRTRTSRSSIDFKAERMGAGGEVDVVHEDLARFRAEMSLCDKFAGGDPDLQAAEGLLRRTHLWSDANMRTLLEMRGTMSNRLLERKLVLSLSSEAKSNLSVSARLNLPTIVDVSGGYERAISEEQEYSLTVVVRF